MPRATLFPNSQLIALSEGMDGHGLIAELATIPLSQQQQQKQQQQQQNIPHRTTTSTAAAHITVPLLQESGDEGNRDADAGLTATTGPAAEAAAASVEAAAQRLPTVSVYFSSTPLFFLLWTSDRSMDTATTHTFQQSMTDALTLHNPNNTRTIVRLLQEELFALLLLIPFLYFDVCY